MTFDVDAFRSAFPSLRSGIAHFDGPGGTQTPHVVGQAVADTLTGSLSNRGTGSLSESNADEAVRSFRAAFGDLLASDPAGIVYGRSATQLAYDVSRALAKTWGPGDEVVVSALDHDANIRPWIQAADRAGASVRWLELDPDTADLRLDDLDDLITERTRLVAVTGASNLIGTRPPVARIAERAHAVGALVYVDGVHHAAHTSVDRHRLGADFFACSPYKFFGPHCGVLAADPALLETLQPDKLLPSTNAVPDRFELGTLPYEIMAGARAAVDFIADVASEGRDRRARLEAAHAAIDEHELRLRQRVETALLAWSDRLTLHSRAADRTPTLFVTFHDRDPAAAYRLLVDRQVLAPAGTFYAVEPFRRLRTDAASGLRIGIAPYNTEAEVDRLIEGLEQLLA